ncbi:MAG: dihydrofolate reductase family protein [Nesterenkonia sp.]
MNVLGSDVAAQCLKAGVLHELIISTVPTLLGGGTPVFRDLEGSRALTLIRSAATSIGHTVHYCVPLQEH